MSNRQLSGKYKEIGGNTQGIIIAIPIEDYPPEQDANDYAVIIDKKTGNWYSGTVCSSPITIMHKGIDEKSLLNAVRCWDNYKFNMNNLIE